MEQNKTVVTEIFKPLDPIGVRGDEPIDDAKESRLNIEAQVMPVVTDIGPKECIVSVPMAACRHCGYAGPFHIPAFPACEEDDNLFDAHVECPVCECHGPAACHDSDDFCSTRNEARSRAVHHWNRPPPVIELDIDLSGDELDSPSYIVVPQPIAMGMTAMQAIRRLKELNDILNCVDTHFESVREAQREKNHIFEAFK